MLDKLSLKPVIEALIFASEVPLTVDKMAGVIEGADKAMVKEALAEVISEHRERSGGIYIEEVAGGYVFRTNPEFAPHLRRLFKIGLQKISKAAMETLAVIAYKQPVTRAELEGIRGVDSGGVLATLMEKRFIKIVGRKEVPGRPVVYGTTKEFLETFDLKDLSELPSLKDIQRMEEENAAENPEGAKDSIEDSVQISPEDETILQDGVQEGASAPTEEELPDRVEDSDEGERLEGDEPCPDETEGDSPTAEGGNNEENDDTIGQGPIDACPDETEPDNEGACDEGERLEGDEPCPDETEGDNPAAEDGSNEAEDDTAGQGPIDACPDETEPDGGVPAGEEGREEAGQDAISETEPCPDETEPGEASEDNSGGRDNVKEKG